MLHERAAYRQLIPLRGVGVQMQEDYSLATGRSLSLAHFEARDVCAEEVGGEHLLVGLAANSTCRAGALLAHLGLSDAQLRSQLTRRPPPSGPLGHLPTGYAVTHAFERAFERTADGPKPTSTIDLLVAIFEDRVHQGGRELVLRCGITPEIIVATASSSRWQDP